MGYYLANATAVRRGSTVPHTSALIFCNKSAISRPNTLFVAGRGELWSVRLVSAAHYSRGKGREVTRSLYQQFILACTGMRSGSEEQMSP